MTSKALIGDKSGGIHVDEPCINDGNLVSGRTDHDNGHNPDAGIRMLEDAKG